MNGANNERFKPMNQTPVKVRRKFDEMFKREAVQNWLASGKSAEAVARELGLLAYRLSAWKQTFFPVGAGGKGGGGEARFTRRSPQPTGRRAARGSALARAA